jgi:16S rRNA (adenine1518-N6/adenine1519-N6)-dimethyltransferase
MRTLGAKKRLGQNFLVDESFVSRIIREVGPSESETLIEIGAGRGALTAQLLESAGRVVAVEFDRDLVPLLRARFGARDNFNLVEDDALEVDFCSAIVPAASARVVANLPYNISTAILRRLIEQQSCIREMVLMLQREVVERITAPAGSSERGFLSVFVQAHCETEKLFDVPPDAFRPVPRVWSTVVRLRPRGVLSSDVKEDLLWKIVSAGFAQRRKTILNNLRSAPDAVRRLVDSAGGASSVLDQAGIDSQRRAETLELSEWLSITSVVWFCAQAGASPSSRPVL